MTMRLLGWAMLLVALDPSLNGFDVLPDVAGWAIAFAVLEDRALSGRRGSRDFARGQYAALVAAVLGAASMALFFSEQPFEVLRACLWLGEVLAALCASWWLLMGVATASAPHERDLVFTSRRLAVALAAVLAGRATGAAWALVVVLTGRDATLGDGAVWVALRVLGALLDLAVQLGLVLLLFRVDDRPWLQPRPVPTSAS